MLLWFLVSSQTLMLSATGLVPTIFNCSSPRMMFLFNDLKQYLYTNFQLSIFSQVISLNSNCLLYFSWVSQTKCQIFPTLVKVNSTLPAAQVRPKVLRAICDSSLHNPNCWQMLIPPQNISSHFSPSPLPLWFKPLINSSLFIIAFPKGSTCFDLCAIVYFQLHHFSNPKPYNGPLLHSHVTPIPCGLPVTS